MRSLNPACKFLGLLVVTFVLAARRDPLWNLVAFAISLCAILCARVRLKVFLLLLAPVLLAALGMFFTGYRFSATGAMPVRADAFLMGNTALWNGLLQASRVLAYAGLGYAFALTTDRIFLVRSFQRQFHLPQVFAYGLLAAWGVFPHMVQEFRRTKAAFRARGIRVFPVSPALLAPILVKSVRWSEELAVAMESKGFSGQAKRTDFSPVCIQKRDWGFLFCCCLLFPLAAVFLP